MCTTSWGNRTGSDGLIFNRDEQRRRVKALSPASFDHDGVRIIAPLDELGGGTWLSVNEYGFCAALLNNYDAEASSDVVESSLRSRGLVPLAFMKCRGVEESAQLWEEFETEVYRPFLVLFSDRVGLVRLFSWNGTMASERRIVSPMVTTSSHRTEEVESYRRSLFEARACELENFDRLSDFHFDESNLDMAFNPLMSREDAITHNVSRVDLVGDEIVFSYWERNFDSGKLGSPMEQRMKLVREVGF